MPRTMPKKGFYVYEDDILTPKGYKDAVYTTGVRGGGGHKYCRSMGNTVCNPIDRPMEWVTLLWSCVPSQRELDEYYTYYENFEDIPKHWEFPDFPA